MPIVSLTTDFGYQDYYLGSLKGALLCVRSDLNIVDITHNVKPFDIVQAAFILKNTFPSFPKGTIHIISVNNFYNSKPCFVALEYQEQFFIAPDNGVLSLMFDTLPEAIYELEYSDESTFPFEEIYGKAVDHIVKGQPFHEIGILLDSITERITYNPVKSSNQLKGTVIHIDRFGNVITNISEDLFKETAKGRSFQLFYKRTHPLNKISRFYSDVPVGEPLCLFNSMGYLELAINMGQAASLLNLKLEDTIQLDFMPSL